MRLYMSEQLLELAGETMLMFVQLNLGRSAGFAVYGGGEGEEFDKFLVADGRLLLGGSAPELLAALPPAGPHSFDADDRFTRFVRRAKEIELFVASGESGDRVWLYDFAGTLAAIRDRQVLDPPHSGMALDCVNAALELGRQFGKSSPGFELARFGPLDVLYQVIWGESDAAELDYPECASALERLIDWIEWVAAPVAARETH